MITLLCLCSCSATPLIQHQEEWVVKALIAAVPEAPDERAGIYVPSAQGDLDGDLRTDIAFESESIPPPFSGRPAWDSCILYSGLQKRPAWKRTTERTVLFMDYSRIRLPLRRPQGWTILLDSGIHQSIELYDMKSGLQIGAVQVPPPPAAGVPASGGFYAVYPAGDVNLDGYDDAFWVRWTGSWSYAGLIDGATLTVAWQYYDVDCAGGALPSFGAPSLPPDLDGDLVSDFLFCQGTRVGSQYGHSVAALSGRTGAVLWSRRGSGLTTTGNTWGKDLNDDGVADVILALDNDSVHALDGANGQTLWSLDLDTLNPFFSSGYRYRFFSGSLISRSVLDGKDEVTMVVRFNYPLDEEWKVAHLDGRTGAIRAVVEQPIDVEPFASVGIWSNTYNYYPLGDVDRDGLMEFGVPFHSYETAPPWSTGPEIHYAVLGQRTLFLPDQARLGDSLDADVSIPSAGGMDCTLLLSTNFRPVGGWTIDGVQTNLDATDPVFQATLGRAELRTRLGPQGKGLLSFVLPQIPSLIGKRIHARALIRNPANGEVWTVSSPSSVLVVP